MKNNVNKNGIYLGIRIDTLDREKIVDFCKNNLKIKQEEMGSPFEKRIHTTILTSESSYEDSIYSLQKCINNTKKFIATPDHWQVLESLITGDKCLILKLKSKDLESYHEEIKEKSGLTHVFGRFNPHISIHYKFNQEVPKHLPDFPIVLSDMYIKPYYNKSKDNMIKIKNK